MKRRQLLAILCCVWLLWGCSSGNESPHANKAALPTPENDLLQVSGVSNSGARLRLILYSVQLLKPAQNTQLYAFLVDPQGTYTYLLYPANRAGTSSDQFDLTASPLELSLSENSSQVTLWIFAVHHTRYSLAESYGIEALSTSLALGFREWLTNGNPDDDPLAAVVSGSEGALYNWFAEADVLGESTLTLSAADGWNVGMGSLESKDQGLKAVYAVQHVSSEEVAEAAPSATPTAIEPHPGYMLFVDETFDGGTSKLSWYQGQDETYINHIIDGAYEIQLTDILERAYALSWGSIDDQHFTRYAIDADVTLLDGNAANARYGIWFNYQDDYNFLYFGISSRGEYRVAVFQNNNKMREIMDWTPSSAIRTGAATNTLSIETEEDGSYALSINGQRLLTFADRSFNGGSIAFFCYAESVPTTCQLDRLRIWEPAS